MFSRVRLSPVNALYYVTSGAGDTMNFTETALQMLDDPVRFAWRYVRQEDREVAAFIAASFAFGNVKAMLSALEGVFALLAPSPHIRLQEGPISVPGEFRYRYVKPGDLETLLTGLSHILKCWGTLGALVQDAWDRAEGPPDYRRLRKVMKAVYRELSLPADHPLVADPGKNSALKRWCLFFRWMVRTEPPDLGLWTFIPPRALCIPLDIHIFRLSRRMGWTRRKTPDWKAVEEIMEHLRAMNPDDPVGPDFVWYREERRARLQAR